MLILCILLAAALLLSVGFNFWRERIHRAVTADLLDRVMARNFGEYAAAATAKPSRPLRRSVLSDEDMAELEQRSLAEKAARA